MSSGAEPASRLVRLLRQLEATCNAHADAALSRNRSGMAGHGQTMHRAPAAVPSAAGLTLAACRGSHVQAGPFLLAGARYQPGTAASLLLGRAARSSRFAGAPMPQQARHSGLTARLHSGLSTASGAAPASRPQGGGQQPPPPKGSPSRHVWQQERGRSWAAANAVQPAAAGVPAVQYAPRYQPQRHEHFALPNAPQPRPQQQAQPPALRPTAPPPAVFEQRAQPGAQMQGLVQRVTYHSQETGYCVLKLQVRSSICGSAFLGSAHAGLLAAGRPCWLATCVQQSHRCWSFTTAHPVVLSIRSRTPGSVRRRRRRVRRQAGAAAATRAGAARRTSLSSP